MQNFDEIYNKLKENYKDLDIKRKKTLGIILLTLLVIIIVVFFASSLLFTFLLIPASIIFLIIFATINSRKFNKEFKQTIIRDLVKYYDPNLYFSPDSSIRSSLYNDAEFEKYDNFNSNDYIYGRIGGKIEFQLSDVRTTNVSIDENGRETEITIFRGLFSASNLETDINGKIKIHSDKGLIGKFVRNKDLLHMDSQEFEKYFDVYSEQKILAMRILTSDIMDYLISFKKDNKIKFEITIKNSSFYIRIHCRDMFEGHLFLNVLDYNTLKKYYNYLNFMCLLNQKIYNILNEKNL